MEIGHILALVMFFIGYFAISLEHKLNTSKSAIALILAGLLWVTALAQIGDRELVHHAVLEAGAEVFEIVAFLLTAMSLVEILIHYRFFDVIAKRIDRLKLTDIHQFYILAFLTFFFSAALDNLTVTIVMIQIARRFFKGENMLKVAAGLVIVANAGGAWSPVGDVTTIMLWLADKFDASQVILEGILPSMVIGVIATLMIGKQIVTDTRDSLEDRIYQLTRGEKLIIGTTLASFTLPLIMNTIGLPPYIGLLLGLGFVWMIIEFVKTRSYKETHLTANIEKLIQKTDIASLQFFIGILLAVSALGTLGVLDDISTFLFSADPSLGRVIFGNTVLGLLSALVDNVPLTAIAIDIIHFPDPALWVLTAIAVGTGGSALVIGSVAGVIAMGMVKGLTFGKYLKIATPAAVISYFAAIAVWYLQYVYFFS